MIYLAIYFTVGVVYLAFCLIGQVAAARAGVDKLRVRMPVWAWPLFCLAVVAFWPAMLVSLIVAVRRAGRG